MKQHFFFDLDNTLTESTCKLSPSMAKALMRMLQKGGDVIVVSGARREKIIEQLGQVAEETYLLAQNGNHAETASGQPLWKHEFNWIQKMDVLNLISKLKNKAENVTDTVQDRGCQISFSLTGHNAPLEVKRAADPDKKARLLILDEMSAELDELASIGVFASIGGTTCIDFYLYDKGHNVDRLIEARGWKAEECVYVGDALFPGGNDHSVVGIIDTVQVSGPVETEKFIKQATELMRGDMGFEDEEEEDDEEESDEV